MGTQSFATLALAQKSSDGCNTTVQRRSAAKLMYASADASDKQFPAGQIKRAFGKTQKSAKSRITSILLVNFRCLESNNHISASAQNESFVELSIFMTGPNEMR